MREEPYCLTCGENPTSTDESRSEFIDNHTVESCPAGEPVIEGGSCSLNSETE